MHVAEPIAIRVGAFQTLGDAMARRSILRPRHIFFIRRAHKSGAGSSLARPAWQAYARPLSGAAVPGRPWPGTTPLSLPVPWLPGVFFSGTTDCPGGVPGWAGWRDKGMVPGLFESM